jgi:acyl-CoA synthetase (AMP-forming)/AMP-acid ligase II
MTNTILTLFSADRSQEYYRAGFWCRDTVYSLVKAHAARAPESIAVRGSYASLTYRELLLASDSLAVDLASKGVVAGQRVAVWLPSRIETVIAFVACSRNGYVCCPSLHRDHTVDDVVALLTRMRASAIVAEAGYGADADQHDVFKCVQQLDFVKHAYRLDKCDQGSISKQIVTLKSPDELSHADNFLQDPDRIVYLAFTSGTTGMPKGVMHSSNTLLANARAICTDWSIDQRSAIYSLSPLSHNLGFGAMVMALLTGAQFIIHDLPRGRSLAERLKDTGATFLVGVPTHAIDLLNELKARNLFGLSKLKGFRISGAAAPREVIRGLLELGITPQSGYGMTETCSHQYTLPYDDEKLIVETSGRVAPGYEIQIFRSDNLNELAATGEIGQIGGRGASLMLGYFDDQATTEDSFNRDGWFMTGDLGWLDEKGYLRITGRKKDVIIRGGHNIFPAKLESLASSHQAIHRAAAVPVPDSRLGEKVCLAVTFYPGKQVSSNDILAHLYDLGLSKYDMPEYFLELDHIPLTASGKIKKRDIAEWIADGHIKPTPIRWPPEAV